jgi:hypothetical protein
MALFGVSRPDHPMADLKQARSLISEFPAQDSTKAVGEVTFWLDSLSRTDGFKLDYRFELYDALDYAAKSHQRKLSQDYLATDRQEKFRESKLWNTLFEFWKTLGTCYSQCIEEYQTGGGGAGLIKKDLPTVVARALRALTLQLKWSALRYGVIDDQVWSELGRIYLFADSKRLTTAPVQIYPGVHGQGTVQQEFLKALMLGVSSMDGLTPLKQQIAERIVAHFGELYQLQAKPGSACNYYFDLTMRKPPARVIKSSEANATTRYFGPGKALPALRQMMDSIKASHSVPPDINLDGSYEPDLVRSVMTHLALYWSDKPPARSSERRKIATRLTVVHGLDEILRCIKPRESDNSLDFQVKHVGESWIVENVSAGGFGAIVPPVKGDWIKIGSVLGVMSETAKYWGAGIVRRLTCDEFQQRRVGIEILSKAVIPVRLSPAGNVSSISVMREGNAAVLLSTTPDRHGNVGLLLNTGAYTANQSLEMDVHGKRYYLMPQRLVEAGEDFDLAKFRVLKNT